MRYLSLLLVFVANFGLAAEYKFSPVTKVKFIASYNEYGGGDVRVELEAESEDCPNGYWFTTADPGFQANFSMVLAAYQADTKVRILGFPSVKWPGSTTVYCKIYSVEYHK